jgi:soluble cytochrome b562
MNTATLENNEIRMFGTKAKNLEQSFATAYNINMRLAGMLSDAQELLSAGNVDQANQIINQVKYCIFEYTDTRNWIPAQKQD